MLHAHRFAGLDIMRDPLGDMPPPKTTGLPNSASMASSRLYFAMRSERQAVPVLIWPPPAHHSSNKINRDYAPFPQGFTVAAGRTGEAVGAMGAGWPVRARGVAEAGGMAWAGLAGVAVGAGAGLDVGAATRMGGAVGVGVGVGATGGRVEGKVRVVGLTGWSIIKLLSLQGGA